MGAKEIRAHLLTVWFSRWVKKELDRLALGLNRKCRKIDPGVLLGIMVFLGLAMGLYCLWLVLAVFR